MLYNVESTCFCRWKPGSPLVLPAECFPMPTKCTAVQSLYCKLHARSEAACLNSFPLFRLVFVRKAGSLFCNRSSFSLPFPGFAYALANVLSCKFSLFAFRFRRWNKLCSTELPIRSCNWLSFSLALTRPAELRQAFPLTTLWACVSYICRLQLVRTTC